MLDIQPIDFIQYVNITVFGLPLALLVGMDSKHTQPKGDEMRCYNRPRYGERLMCALNEILGGYGVEALTCDGELMPEYEYVNMGDTYTLTIVRDCTTGQVLVTTWGDIIERWDNDKRV